MFTLIFFGPLVLALGYAFAWAVLSVLSFVFHMLTLFAETKGGG